MIQTGLRAPYHLGIRLLKLWSLFAIPDQKPDSEMKEEKEVLFNIASGMIRGKILIP